jgi:uncharacterized protein (TIGR03086 family)
MVMIDLGPATDRMAQLLASIGDEQLGAPTPCPNTSLGDLVDHIGSLTTGFTLVARKESGSAKGVPTPDATNLEAGWRERVTGDLRTLAIAWREPAAWDGMTKAAGIDLPGEVAGLVALDELVVHGWDVAVASDQAYDPTVDEIEAATQFVTGFDAPRDGNLFGPIVAASDDASPLDRLLGLTGRDPRWAPPVS